MNNRGGMDWMFKAVQRVELARLQKMVETMGEEMSKKISGTKNGALLTSKEIAPHLGVTHAKTVERWVREKNLPCVRIGRNLRFKLGDVLQWRAQQES